MANSDGQLDLMSVRGCGIRGNAAILFDAMRLLTAVATFQSNDDDLV